MPRRSIVAEIRWIDGAGPAVPLDQQPDNGFLRGATAMAEPEFPATRGTDPQGWTEVSDTYQAPSRASRAIVELHLRWAPDSTVRWSGVSLTETDARRRRARSGWRPSISGPAAARRPPTTAGCTSR